MLNIMMDIIVTSSINIRNEFTVLDFVINQ